MAKAFVAVNCSTFSREMLESELFGFRADSFTGATRDKRGLFEEAHGGTLFLDEIGEMALELQAKLLRILETGEFLKVGDSQPTRVNVRVIAATNRDLEKQTIRRALAFTKGNKAEAARLLGIGVTTLYRKLEE